MAEHRTYKCTEENGESKCELIKTEPSCEEKVTFITKDDSCGCSE
jgi:hypothetical protein